MVCGSSADRMLYADGACVAIREFHWRRYLLLLGAELPPYAGLLVRLFSVSVSHEFLLSCSSYRGEAALLTSFALYLRL